MKYFDIQRDHEIIAAGGFLCGACLVGKPANAQSSDPQYCQDCYDVLHNDELPLAEIVPDAFEQNHTKAVHVSNISGKGNTREKQNMKQRGRPRKQDKLSRTTRWRRTKEERQGILL